MPELQSFVYQDIFYSTRTMGCHAGVVSKHLYLMKRRTGTGRTRKRSLESCSQMNARACFSRPVAIDRPMLRFPPRIVAVIGIFATVDVSAQAERRDPHGPETRDGTRGARAFCAGGINRLSRQQLLRRAPHLLAVGLER